MKITCGTDIIEIERIKSSIENIGDKFLEKIFTEKEIEYCESKKNQKYQHYAGRFAAKEAIFKAISSKINGKCEWKDYEILSDENGRPKVSLKNPVENLECVDMSISHCKSYAIAYVTAIFED